MGKIVINGGKRLFGSVCIHGAKNAVLPVMAASLMNEGVTVIRGCPDIADVRAMCGILNHLHCKTDFKKGCLVIDTSMAEYEEIKAEDTKQLRASSVLMGPVLTRFGRVRLAYPGGCSIGSRPLDIHLHALKCLGASWSVSEDFIEMETTGLHPSEITLRFPSVGATENALMAAAAQCGTTVLYNAAKEPEIESLCAYLEKCGAVITGAGTECIRVRGKGVLQSAEFFAKPDRIVAGTYMAAVAAAGGDITVHDVIPKHLESITAKLEEMGVEITEYDEAIRVVREKPLAKCNIKTMPHPGFPTDMQPQIAAVLCLADGTSIINENVWDNRFRYVEELRRLGAQISVDGKIAVIEGVKELVGAPVKAMDLRAGAAMVVAGLAARGVTEIENIEYIERGYENIVEKLQGLGADIRRVYFPEASVAQAL